MHLIEVPISYDKTGDFLNKELPKAITELRAKVGTVNIKDEKATPIPAQKEIFVKIGGSKSQVVDYQILDLTGRVVQSGDLVEKTGAYQIDVKGSSSCLG